MNKDPLSILNKILSEKLKIWLILKTNLWLIYKDKDYSKSIGIFKSAFVDFHLFLFLRHRRINLFDFFASLIGLTSHHVLLHLEFQAAVISCESFGFSIFVLSHHQWRIALFSVAVCDQETSSDLSELFEKLVFGEKVMVQGLSRRYTLHWIFLK